MRKLFLASRSSFLTTDLSKDFIAQVGKDFSNMTIAYIPTASDVILKKGSAKKYFQELGTRIKIVDLKEQSAQSLRQAFSGVDVVYVGGGNTFYLLYHVKRSGFDRVATEFIDQGIVYAGSSAGAYIACPTIEMATWKHSDRNDIGLTDLSALNQVPFLITAHYEERVKSFIQAGVTQTTLPVVALTDEQAIVAIDNHYTIVGPGEKHTWNHFSTL